jgi:Tol biopolymer transport system component
VQSDISGNGKFVVFHAFEEFAPGGDPAGIDVFRWNRMSKTFKLISVGADEEPGDGFSGSRDAKISSDGNFVVFSSDASTFVPDDAGEDADLFRRDVAAGDTARVTIDFEGGEPEEEIGSSGWYDISGNGRWVVFSSDSPDLVNDAVGSDENIYARDVSSGVTYWASQTTSEGPPDGSSYDPHISRNGSWVLFSTQATNFFDTDINGSAEDAIRAGKLP